MVIKPQRSGKTLRLFPYSRLRYKDSRRQRDKAVRLLVLALLVPLAGCSYTTYISNADEHGGTVNLVTGLSHDGAVENAKDYCRKYNLAAVITHEDAASSSMTFTCQQPPQ